MNEKIVLCSLGQTFAADEIRDRYYAPIYDYLVQQGFQVSIVNGRENDEELTIRQLEGADGVIFSSNGPVTERVLDSLPKLKLILRMGVGLNSVDLKACSCRGVIVCNTPGYCDEELAVHGIALGLSVLRNLRTYDRKIREGVWMKGNGVLPFRPSRMTAGIFGLGASGRCISKILHNGFGSNVLAYDPYVTEQQAMECGAGLTDFGTLLEQSDMIFVAAPLTKDTYHAFDQEAFRRMKNTAIIVNISRGAIIDDDALAEALKKGEIAKAGLDVFEMEPLPTDSPLLSLENVIVTPHNAYYGRESVDDLNLLTGHIVADAFNKKKLYRKHLCNSDVMSRLEGFSLVCEEINLHS